MYGSAPSIGSDEDEEEADETASAGDPSETAVSRDAEKERSFSGEIAAGASGTEEPVLTNGLHSLGSSMQRS